MKACQKRGKKKHVSLSQLLGVERSDADFTSSVLSLLLCRYVSRTKKTHDPGFLCSFIAFFVFFVVVVCLLRLCITRPKCFFFFFLRGLCCCCCVSFVLSALLSFFFFSHLFLSLSRSRLYLHKSRFVEPEYHTRTKEPRESTVGFREKKKEQRAFTAIQ